MTLKDNNTEKSYSKLVMVDENKSREINEESTKIKERNKFFLNCCKQCSYQRLPSQATLSKVCLL